MQIGNILIPVVTPFNKDGTVDYDRFAKLVQETSKEHYCDSVIIMATTGEFASLSIEEREGLIRTASRGGSNKPLIAGTGAITTEDTIRLTKVALESGADVALILPPYYYRPSQSEIFSHYKMIAEKVNIPILIYNLVITGVNISPPIIAKLAEIDNIVGVKEIGTELFQTAELMYELKKKQLKKEFRVFAGSAKLALPLFSQGATGVVTEGIVGAEIKEIIRLIEEGNISKASEIFVSQIIPYFRIYTKCGVVPGLKYALNLMGFDVGIPRKPLMEVTEEQKDFIKETLSALGKC